MPLPTINFLHFTVSEILSGQILKVKVTMASSKVKSRSHHDVAHLQAPTNVPTKYQLPTHFAFRDIAQTWFYRSRSLQGQIKVTSWHCTPTPPNHCPYQVSISYTLQFPRYSLDKILKIKVKSRSHHDVAYLHAPNQCPYQVSTSYTLQFPRYTQDKIL